MSNDKIVTDLEECIKLLLNKHGVEYHRFECRNFADLNCDITLQIHSSDIFPTFIYSSLQRIKDDINNVGFDAVVMNHCCIIIKKAYESYHAMVSENRRIVQSTNYKQSLVDKAGENLKHQEPLFEKLNMAWYQISIE